MDKKYHIEFSKKALKDLKKMDGYTGTMLVNWINKNLENCENPFFTGKALKGNLINFWRYRVGDYRIIANIEDEKLIILLVKIGHRRDVYKK
ncbi:type II toxin-antitoxin system RelE family toxin [Faecalicoccus acidiformans]|uniref:type II toxin-antitoxin system RelE family toxin n=1 Tax=Faecalicoccus acidiformans TaxID=915173 RepID=UPI0023573343|nr:type II toxin-antitoxin system RelE/ParE family toxin [Faecalicoccus acidiformans]